MGGTAPGDEDNDIAEPPRLRQLRWLVNALTITLIAGFVVIAATLVIRLTASSPAPVLPGAVALPAGESAGAVTFGKGWLAVVTVDGAGRERIRVFDAESGRERLSAPILPSD